MKKITRNLFVVSLVLLMLFGMIGCSTENKATDGVLQVNTVEILPYAYINEEFDLRDVILMEDGVKYSAQVCYIKMTVDPATKDYTTEEVVLPVEDLRFTPTEIEENVVTITAKRGKETASKVIYIGTTVRAEPLDALYSSNGKLGTTDPGITKSVNIDPMYLKGENSTTSLHVSFNSVDPHAWGNSFMDLSAPEAQEYFTDQIWENAIVTFWVYNPNELAIEFQFYVVDSVGGVTRDWNTADGPHKQIAQPGQWTQLFFSMRKLGVTSRLTKNQYTTDTLKLKFRYDGYNTEESYAMDFYMDDLDVVDASMYPQIDTKYIMSNESLEQGWENMLMDTGWQGVYTEYDYDIKQSDDSNCSLKAAFDNDKALTNSFIALSPQSDKRLEALPDMTGGTFSGYFKFENMKARVSIDIVNDKWTTSNQVDFKLKSVGDGWYYGEVDLEDLQVGTGRNDNIIRIRLNFHGVSKNSVVYVDNCKFVYKHVNKVLESVSADWINMSPDNGSSYYCVGDSEFSTAYLKGGNTVRSLKLVAPSNTAGRYTFNTEKAVKSGEISALPNMTKGTLGAWFYFGSQTPKASFFMTNSKWKGSNWVDFVFVEDAGNGWYYGAINASSLVCEEGGGTSSVYRMTIMIPKGYTVYVDNLSWKPKDESLVQIVKNDEILTSVTNGSVQNKETNGSSAAWKVVPDLGTEHNWAYPKLTLDQAYSEGNYKLVMDVKPVKMEDFQINLSVIDGKWLSGVTSTHLPVDQWTTVSFDIQNKAISNFNLGVEIVGGAADYAFYIDNVKLIPVEEEENSETVEDDWIHMAIDEGMTNAGFSFVQDMVKAEGSTQSLRLNTADAKIKFTISPQWEFDEKKVDMSNGILSGYFHFSDESAEKVYVAADLYAGNWRHTGRLDFELESVGDGWYYGTLDTSKYDFSATDLAAGATKMDIIRIELLFRQNIIIHVDGLKFEPKTVEDVVNDEIVTAISNNAEGIVQAEVTNNSAAAWKVIPSLGTEHNWAYPQFILDQEYAVDGHKLVMDVKPVNMESFRINLSVVDGTWLSGVVSTSLPVGEWTTVSFDLTAASINNFHLGVEIIGGENYAFYVDNIQLIPAEPEQTEETVEDDWIHMAIDEGMTNAGFSFVQDMVKAEGSTQSLRLDTADAKIKFTLSPEWELAEKKVDMSNGVLSGYFHFSDESAEKVYVAADLYAGNWKHTDRLVFELESVGDGWYYGTLDTSKYDFTAADLEAGASKTDIIRIQLLFRQNIIVHVDGLCYEAQALEPETVEDDWINMAIDEGMTNAGFSFAKDMVKAEGSTQSLRLDTADAKIKFTISPQWQLAEKKVDMSNGILSGYFHFSDESAEKVYVAADLYAGNWKHTDRLVFELESVGDGWYYGTLDTSKYDFTAADLEAGASKTDIIRIQLLFRQNIIVHVDGLKFENQGDQNDMFTGGQQAGGSQWSSANNLTYISDCTDTYGEGSTTAWKFSAGAANANQWAQFLMQMLQSYNMDGYYLVFDAKVEGVASQKLSLRPRTGAEGANDPCNNTVLELTSGWNTYTVDFAAGLKATSSPEDLTLVQRIFLVFDFAANTGSDRSIIIDNVRLEKK